jgi:hypothetical protein
MEMAIGKMIAGNYIQRRSQTGAPSTRNMVILFLHMVSPNTNVTFSKARLHCAVGPLYFARLHCAAGPLCLSLSALCCGAAISLLDCAVLRGYQFNLSLPDCAVLRGYPFYLSFVFARLRCDAEPFCFCSSAL